MMSSVTDDWKRNGWLRRVGSASTALLEPESGAVEGACCLAVGSKNLHSGPHWRWHATGRGLEHGLGRVVEELFESDHLLYLLGSSIAWHNIAEQRVRGVRAGR
jgi:hypothetical protein